MTSNIGIMVLSMGLLVGAGFATAGVSFAIMAALFLVGIVANYLVKKVNKNNILKLIAQKESYVQKMASLGYTLSPSLPTFMSIFKDSLGLTPPLNVMSFEKSASLDQAPKTAPEPVIISVSPHSTNAPVPREDPFIDPSPIPGSSSDHKP